MCLASLLYMVTLEQCGDWPCTLCSPLSRTGEVACVKYEIYTQNLAAVKDFPTNNEPLWTSFDINIGNIQQIIAAFTSIVVIIGNARLLCPCINHTVTFVRSWINETYPPWPPDAWYFCITEIKTVFFFIHTKNRGVTVMQIFTRSLERQPQCLVKPKKEWKMCMFTSKSRIGQLLSVDT